MIISDHRHTLEPWQGHDWRAIHDELTQPEVSSLSAEELDLLRESLFWLNHPDDPVTVLGQAFTAHVRMATTWLPSWGRGKRSTPRARR